MDSNILFDDYFFERFYTKLLLEISRDQGYKVYLSRVVLEEVKDKLLRKVSEVKNEFLKTKTNIEKLRVAELNIDAENFLSDAEAEFLSYIESLGTDDNLEIIEPRV